MSFDVDDLLTEKHHLEEVLDVERALADRLAAELAWALDLLGVKGVANDAAERALGDHRVARGL